MNIEKNSKVNMCMCVKEGKINASLLTCRMATRREYRHERIEKIYIECERAANIKL